MSDTLSAAFIAGLFGVLAQIIGAITRKKVEEKDKRSSKQSSSVTERTLPKNTKHTNKISLYITTISVIVIIVSLGIHFFIEKSISSPLTSTPISAYQIVVDRRKTKMNWEEAKSN